jgi:hypothetical protein
MKTRLNNVKGRMIEDDDTKAWSMLVAMTKAKFSIISSTMSRVTMMLEMSKSL